MNLASTAVSRNEFGDAELSDIVVRGYTPFGVIKALGSIEVEARESVIPDRRQSAYFVRVELQAPNNPEHTASSLLRYDNVDKLTWAIDKLATASIRTDRFHFTELEYEVDGLSIVVFNDAKGKIGCAIRTGGVTVHLTTISMLIDLKSLIVGAKQHLDTQKIEF